MLSPNFRNFFQTLELTNNNNLFYQESNTFRTVLLKIFIKRTQLPKRPPKSTQAFQAETFELNEV